MPTLPLSPAELDYLHTSLTSRPPIRPDLRTPTAFRPLGAETGVLPAVNGSAHVRAADGSEVVLGVRLEVEKTDSPVVRDKEGRDDVKMGGEKDEKKGDLRGSKHWVTLSLTLPGTRDDDSSTISLEETLREGLVTPLSSSTTGANSLQDLLPINTRWHFHLYLDVVLISSSASSSPTNNCAALPLISVGVYLSLLDTRVPLLKSTGEEDPAFEDDWERSTFLYPRRHSTSMTQEQKETLRPPLTLLLCVVGATVLFDPTTVELGVGDAVVAVAVGITRHTDGQHRFRITALRTLDLGARDTFPGFPNDERAGDGESGVWKPKVGGVKRGVFGKIATSVLGEVGEVVRGLDGFVVGGW